MHIHTYTHEIHTHTHTHTHTHLRREVGVLLDLLHAQQYISEWQFLPAILAIQASHNKLSIWNGVVPLGSHVSVM